MHIYIIYIKWKVATATYIPLIILIKIKIIKEAICSIFIERVRKTKLSEESLYLPPRKGTKP